MRKYLSLSLTVIMLLTLVPMLASAEATTIAGTPRSQTLVVDPLIGKTGNPYQCNPYMPGSAMDNGLHQMIYSCLWEMNTITGEQYCDLAATFPEPLNDDFTSFKVLIREGLKWSDGETFDAHDVVFTANMLLEHKDSIGAGAHMSTYVKEFVLVNDYEIIINTLYS